MLNAYVPIVRRALEVGLGPPRLLGWVQAQAQAQATRLGPGHEVGRLAQDYLVEILSRRLADLVAIGMGRTCGRREEPGETLRAEESRV